MGKLTRALLVSTALMVLMPSAPAKAGPLAPILAIAGSALVPTLINAAIGAAISFGLTELVNVIFPPTSNPNAATTSTPTTVTYGDRVNRSGIFGDVLDAGELAYVNEYSNATQLQQIYILGDGWSVGLEPTIFVNGVQYDLITATPLSNHEVARYHVDTFDALIEIRIHDGRPSQLTDTSFVSQGMPSTNTYTNMLYAAVDITSDKEKFSGPPTFSWVIKGLKAYDPRKDTTVGGSGSHRFNDPTTWEFTKNPAVLAYHYLRGFYAGGVLVLGPGLSIADIDLGLAITAMNVCDQDVVRPDATHRKRYEVNYKFDESQNYADVLTVLCQAMGGFFGESQGAIALFAGQAQSVVVTITDKDLVDGEDITFNPDQNGVALFTGIEGTYTSAKDFNTLAYSSIIDSSFETEDGEQNVQSQNYPQVQDAHQSFLLAKQQLFANRFRATADIVLDIKDLQLAIGDWITWTSSRTLIGTNTWRIIKTVYDFTKMRMYLTLRQIDASIWNDTATTLDIVVPTRSYDIAGYLTDVPLIAVHAIPITGTAGQTLPALQFNYSPIFDPGVIAINFEYRIKSPVGSIVKVVDQTVSDGTFITTLGVAPGLLYEARATLNNIPGRTFNVGAWTDADMVTPDISATTSIAPGSVDLAMLAQPLQDAVGVVGFPPGPNSLSSIIAGIQEQIDDLAGAVTTNGVTTNSHFTLFAQQSNNAIAAIIQEAILRTSDTEAFAQYLLQVSAQLDQANANIIAESTARATGDTANATSITQLATSLGSAFSSALFKIDSITSGGGTIATILMQVAANVSSAFTSIAALQLQATQDGLGGSLGSIYMIADRYYMMTTSGALVSAPFSIESGVVKLGVTRAGRITDVGVTNMYIDFDTKEIYMSG